MRVKTLYTKGYKRGEEKNYEGGLSLLLGIKIMKTLLILSKEVCLS